MSAATQIPVAFMFVDDGQVWHGGLNYFRSLFLALQSLPSSSVEPVAFVGAKASISRYEFPASVRVVQDSVLDRLSLKWTLNQLAKKLLGAPWLTNRVIRRHGIGIVSHGSPSRDEALKTIGWIPDFQHVHLPHLFSPREHQVRNRAFEQIATGCNLVLLSSEDARRDFIAFAPPAAVKARVLRFAALPQDPYAHTRDSLAAKYRIDRPYFFVPNQVWAHKNHSVLIAALGKAVNAKPDILIICSGSTADRRDPNYFGKLLNTIECENLQENIRFLGSIPYEYISPLMLHSTAVINPSLFEGWSTTVEEAKALGIPLIVSDISVHREQLPSKAAYFDPKSPMQLADLLLKMQVNSFPSRPTEDINNSVNAHKVRIEQFARNYISVLEELG